MAENIGYGKVILFGEHYVVYGLSGIAGAMEHYVKAKIEKGEGKGFTLIDNRPETPGYKEKKREEIYKAIELMIKFLNIDLEKNPIKIILDGTLVCTSGNGSSSAMSTAIARALSGYFDLGMDDDKINEVSYEGEKASAGTPSGIDNTCATFGGLLIFRKNMEGGPNFIEKITVKEPIEIVIANTGITQSTKEVVADLRKAKESEPEKYERIFREYDQVFEEGKKALGDHDLKKLGELFDKNQDLLRESTISCDEIETIVRVAKDNGALGAKLTGTGRGGNVIALTPGKDLQDKVAEAIEKEGFMTTKTRIGV
ncbi:MAG: mevalonate kinase [Candidatus Aenigmarchaeota archaeon]|nr:mevalonate kinase [Candidatus Aenigmarchaeota archaeon]